MPSLGRRILSQEKAKWVGEIATGNYEKGGNPIPEEELERQKKYCNEYEALLTRPNVGKNMRNLCTDVAAIEKPPKLEALLKTTSHKNTTTRAQRPKIWWMIQLNKSRRIGVQTRRGVLALWI